MHTQRPHFDTYPASPLFTPCINLFTIMACKPLPLDPALAQWLPKVPTQKLPNSAEELLTPNILHEERTFCTTDGTELIMSIFRRKREPGEATAQKRPGLYEIHGGGWTIGNRFLNGGWGTAMVEKFDVVSMLVEYRFAPAHPDPIPSEDCYAGLLWMVEHAAEFGIDPDRIIVGGSSAGGNLSAGVALLARDRGGPHIMGQVISIPVLDDRCDTFSAHQQATGGSLDRTACIALWDAYLGGRRGTNEVSIYAAPARATDLSSLPPAYVDVGEAEILRDEAVAYAQKLWQCGVPCELHVWQGGFHGYELYCPQTQISMAARDSKLRWLERLLSSKEASF